MNIDNFSANELHTNVRISADSHIIYSNLICVKIYSQVYWECEM